RGRAHVRASRPRPERTRLQLQQHHFHATFVKAACDPHHPGGLARAFHGPGGCCWMLKRRTTTSLSRPSRSAARTGTGRYHPEAVQSTTTTSSEKTLADFIRFEFAVSRAQK